MALRPLISKIARRTAYGLGGTAIVGGSALTAYTYTEQGLGLRRELRFWGKVTPVVFDYWWHVSSSSPLVKFQKRFSETKDLSEPKETEQTTTATTTTTQEEEELDLSDVLDTDETYDDDDQLYDNDAERELYQTLHTRNAPKIFDIMLELGGLYIKLGQVLSVTALPVPSEYRKLFRTLQSNVPGHEEFENVIKPTLEKAFGVPLDDLFESVDEIPCGAASIGQAHKAKLLTDDPENSTDVIIKVQYPDAKWQVPADVHCVGDFLNLCVYFGVVDESSAKLSYEEFSRQFLAELDYLQEVMNLQEVYESSLDPKAPYMRRGVEIPKVFPELCTKRVITMTYLPGPKFEEEARKQLESLGIDTSRGVHAVVREESASENGGNKSSKGSNKKSRKFQLEQSKNSWIVKVAEKVGAMIGVDNILYLVRLARQVMLWSTAFAVQTIQLASKTTPSPLTSDRLLEWAKDHENAISQAEMMDWTSDAIDALFDVHGYQIFNQGLFNADAHPGNILLIQNTDERQYRPKIGLIDYGQCKRLTVEERQKVARLILSVANEESDEVIAAHCRDLGFKTKNDSTEFLAKFAQLMFGKLRSEHLKREWHVALREEDEIKYFPNELSMVYRASVLLRGLAMSFQLNVAVGEKWREHAEAALHE